MSSIGAITGATAAGYDAADAVNNKQDAGVDFSAVLAGALKEEATRAVMTGMSGGAGADGLLGGYSPTQGSGIEQAIIAAASSGEVSDAQIALFMLCMMMQTSGGDGDFSILMQMMSSMLGNIQGDTDGLRNNVMMSDYHPYILDTLDRQVFGTQTPSVTGTGRAILPTEAWKPAVPAITNSQGNRSPAAFRAVIDQFNVESAERYRPYSNGDTYCNIFMWDVTSAMGAEIPHYVDAVTGAPRYYPDIKGARELNAIAIDEWLRTHGPSYGWREVDAETAQRYANAGRPAVTTAGQNRHVQVVCPSKDGGFDPIRGVTIAQAGAKVTNYTNISGIYSSNGLKSVRYFVHD